MSQTDKKFVGWKAPDGTIYQPGDKYTVQGDVTFAAVWQSKVTLNFETNGGTSINSKTYWQNDVVSLGEYVPSRDGYTFNGWYSDSALKNKV